MMRSLTRATIGEPGAEAQHRWLGATIRWTSVLRAVGSTQMSLKRVARLAWIVAALLTTVQWLVNGWSAAVGIAYLIATAISRR